MSHPKKIVIIGPESTGKSTLTEMLAAHYGSLSVSEYARTYIESLNRNYQKDDLLNIAKGQIALEEEKAQRASSLLFCDTDLYVIKVWSEHKYNDCNHWILQQIARRPYDFYLFTDIDMPWEEDPQREYPSPLMRSYFYHIYKDIVIHSGVPWAKVRGNPKERLQHAIHHIEKHFLLQKDH